MNTDQIPSGHESAQQSTESTLADVTAAAPGVAPALLAAVDAQVREWLEVAESKPVHPSARQLADVLEDPAGLDFTVGFIDRVIRTEDTKAAAHALRTMGAGAPGFLPKHQQLALAAGRTVSKRAPQVVIPAARAVLRRMVSHLLIDASDSSLTATLKRLHSRGVRPNINLLGEAVLGRQEADRRLADTRKLLERDDVDYVSIKVSSAVAPATPWAFQENVGEMAERLLPLYTYAAEQSARGVRKFINLDMEEYHDLDTTIEVFTRLLDRPELLGLEAGIVLQAYLPDALGAMVRLQEWAAARRERGGAPIKVRLVKGANLPMEQVAASLHGWPAATCPSKQATDANYKRVLHWALTPERIANVRIGVAGHNLFDLAHAWILAGERGVRDGVEMEMLLGMAEGEAEAVRETVGHVLLYVPVVHPKDFDVAIAYLVRRLEEGAGAENFMSAIFHLEPGGELYQREFRRFAASLADALAAESAGNGEDTPVPPPNRQQNRLEPVEPGVGSYAHLQTPGTFVNAPDTDPCLTGNRQWAAEVIGRMGSSTLGEELVQEYTVSDPATVERVLDEASEAGAAWGARPAAERAAILRAAAVEFERRRGDLIEVAGSECGKTLDQSDPEVSEAVDFLNYYAHLAEQLEHIDGARHRPVRLTLVVPPWNFPLAIPTGGVAAGLAAGSAVVIKPAPQAARCGSLLVETLWEAGVPREVLRLVHTDEGETGRALIASPLVDRLILTGGYETAEVFRGFRPDLPLLAETSGKNALIVTPSADLDLAAKDLVASAFGHAGQKCSAASLGILVGSVADSERFLRQVEDATRSLDVDYPHNPRAQMGPVIEPADGKLLRGLTELGPGERWLVEPQPLDDTGRLWSPGVRTGVMRGSEFHQTEYFGPVLGLMRAADLPEAIAMANEVAYGLTAGIHSLDRAEIDLWREHIEAGNLYVNRGITGAIVQRQPFGGWKRSSVGAGTKAGGPSYLIGLSDWEPAPASANDVGAPNASVRAFVDRATGLGLDPEGVLARAVSSDAAAWEGEFGRAADVSGLTAEKNLLLYMMRVTL